MSVININNRYKYLLKVYLMSKDLFLIFGYVGSANACIMMIPQIILTIKKKTMEDISILYISLNLLTQCLFLPYTIYFKLYPFLTVNLFLSFYDIWLLSLYYFSLKKTSSLYEELLDEEEKS